MCKVRRGAAFYRYQGRDETATPGSMPQGEMRTGYPVDPTGCFTIVDSDLPESAGTSLVVLPDAPE